MMFETTVGNASNLVHKDHKTEGSARNRIVKAMENMREFAGRYDSELNRECIRTIEQIKNTSLKNLPVNEWYQWAVQADVILYVGVRRTS